MHLSTEKAKLKKEAISLGLIIYFPLIIYLFLLIVDFDTRLFTYLGLLYLVFVIYRKKNGKKVILKNGYFRWFVSFNVCFAFVGFMNLILGGGVGPINYSARHFGIFLSIAVIYYLSLFSDEENIEIFNHVTKIVGMVFIIQFLYSIFESTSSEIYLVESFDWNGTFADYQYSAGQLAQRLQLEYFFQYLDSPFKLLFTGMLGQHNHWGTQLPFYNLIFLFQFFYFKQEKKGYLFLLLLTFIAVLLNTSRFGILAIIISDLFFFAKFTKATNRIKLAFGSLLILSVLPFLSGIIDTLSTYLSLTDTYSSRQDTWEYLWPNIWNRDILSILFGSTLPEIVKLSSSLQMPDFENLSYTIVYEKGMLIYLFLTIVLLLTLIKDRDHPALNRFTNIFVVVNIVLVSLWSNVVFRYTSYVFLTLLLYRASMTTETIEKDEPIVGVV